MSDEAINVDDQIDIVLPNATIGSGVGGDADALAELAEERHEQRTGEAIEATIETPGKPDAQKPARGAKRFEQLTREREAEVRRAEAAERERDELRAKLAQAT